MTIVSGIDALATTVPASSVPADATARRVEFDTLIMETLLKASGVLKVMDESGGEGSPMPISEMMAYPLARQMAEQMDLGFGSMVLRANDAQGE